MNKKEHTKMKDHTRQQYFMSNLRVYEQNPIEIHCLRLQYQGYKNT